MNKEKRLNILLNNLLFIFIILQPFLDIYMGVVKEGLDVFGISIATYIRSTFVIVFTILVIYYKAKYGEKEEAISGGKKRKRSIGKSKLAIYFCIIYLLLCTIYVTLHHLNITNNGGYYITHGLYSFGTELGYILRLVAPILIIYDVILLKPDIKKIELGIVISALTISLVIIITNIFKVSFTSYGDTDYKTVSYNFFNWFLRNDLPYRQTLSKGFFVSANQIGALLVVLLPIVLNIAIKNKKPIYYITVFVEGLSMFLIGTRVASFGFFIVFFVVIFFHLLLVILKKEKIRLLEIIFLIAILGICTAVYLNSPARNRMHASNYEELVESGEIEIANKEDELKLDEFLKMLDNEKLLMNYLETNSSYVGIKDDAIKKYVEENYIFNFIKTKYIKVIYPYEEDPEFWLDMFSKPISVKGDNRGREREIISRIKEKNNNFFLDTLLGLGATPMNGREYMIENDIISHYYNLGIIGVILFVLPYLLCICYMVIVIIKNGIKLQELDKYLDYIIYAFSIIMGIIVAIFAGHVLDEYICNIYLAVISGIIVRKDILFKEI